MTERELSDLRPGDLHRMIVFPAGLNEIDGVLIGLRMMGQPDDSKVYLDLAQPVGVPPSERGVYLRGPYPASLRVQVLADPEGSPL